MSSLTLDFKGRHVRMWSDGPDQFWIASDVAAALDIKNWDKQVSEYEAYEKGVGQYPTPGGLQKFVVLKEPGVYRMIISSRKKEAREFKRWLFCEVLPSIRKTGTYGEPSIQDQIKEAIEAQMKSQEAQNNYNNKMFKLLLSFGASAMATARHHRPKNPNQNKLPFPKEGGLEIGVGHDKG